MKNLVIAACVALVLAACSGDGSESATTTATADQDTTTTEAIPDATTTTAAIAVPDALADHDIDLVPVGDRLMLLAIADSPSLRAQGLKNVDDLEDLDGMLFYWRHEAAGAFWMKDTLIPLDIVWFNEDGTYADRATMVPCDTDPCPTYSPAGGPDYRFAIESEVGDLDWVNESTVIVYSD
ncbi:MAG: DUF192 domain-containing protein [Acidimicrobiia bacterium]